MSATLYWSGIIYEGDESPREIEAARVERVEGGWQVVEELNACVVAPFLSDATIAELDSLTVRA